MKLTMDIDGVLVIGSAESGDKIYYCCEDGTVFTGAWPRVKPVAGASFDMESKTLTIPDDQQATA